MLATVSTVSINSVQVQVDGFLGQQAAAAQAIQAAIRRGDIALTDGNRAADQYLLTILESFQLSAVSILAPAVGTYGAGKNATDSWLSYGEQAGCTKSWLVQGSLRSLPSELSSEACQYDVQVPEDFSSLSEDEVTWSQASYSPSPDACTTHTCGQSLNGDRVLGAARGLTASNGSSLAFVIAERSVDTLNSFLSEVRATSFEPDSATPRGTAHVWMMDVGNGAVLASTDPTIADELAAGTSVDLSHSAMAAVRTVLQIQNESYASSAAQKHLPEVPEPSVLELAFVGLGTQPSSSMVRCSALDHHVADRPDGWAVCFEAPPDFYVSLISPTAWGTFAIFVVHLAVLAVDAIWHRRGGASRILQSASIPSSLLCTFMLWQTFTRTDIMTLTDDLTDHITETVNQRVDQILDIPPTALALLDAHRNMGSLPQGNTTLEDVRQGDAVYLDLLALYPELYMSYTGISFPAAADHATCASKCWCDQATDPIDPLAASCCRAWNHSGDDSFHCSGLADDRFSFFHGAKRRFAGDPPAALQTVGRDLWSLNAEGRMVRRGYVPAQWEDGARSGFSRDWDAVDYEKLYNPIARPWFSEALVTPDRGWSGVYLFSSPDPDTGQKPLGITAMLTTVARGSRRPADRLVPSGAMAEGALFVDAVDYKLNSIDAFLATIKFSPDDGDAEIKGVVFIMEMDGRLIGTSDGGMATVAYYEGATEQRVSCPANITEDGGCTQSGDGTDLVSPIIRLAHQELLQRFGSLDRWKTEHTDAPLVVGQGHEDGPLTLRTVLLESGHSQSVSGFGVDVGWEGLHPSQSGPKS